MTVSTTTAEIIYQGNGSTTAFAVPFVFFGQGELQVFRRLAGTGADQLLTLNSDYTVAGGNGAPGSIVFSSAPPAGFEVVIRRATALTQLTDYLTGDAFPAETHERALDRIVAALQEVNERVTRWAGLPRSLDAPGTGFMANVTLTTEKKIICTGSAGQINVSLPSPASLPGQEITFSNAMTGSATATIASPGYVTRAGSTTNQLFGSATAGAWKVLTATGSVWREMIGS
jgi:hypothetical protein